MAERENTQTTHQMLYQPNQDGQRLTRSRKIRLISLVLMILLVLFHLQFLWIDSQLLQNQRITQQTMGGMQQLSSKMSESFARLSAEGQKLSQVDKAQLNQLNLSISSLHSQVTSKIPQITQTQTIASKLQQLQSIYKQNMLLFDLLSGNTQEMVRLDKQILFDKIANSSNFLIDDIGLPWNISQYNFQPIYMNTVIKKHLKKKIANQTIRLNKKYKINNYPQELPMCVVMITHNNAKNYQFQMSLQSILNQNYTNRKLVIIDNASKDKTQNLIDIILRKKYIQHTMIFLQQKQTVNQILYNGIRQYCQQDDIVVPVYGSDQMFGIKVFQLINTIFQTRSVNIAYTNYFLGVPSEKDNYQPIQLRPYEHQNYRESNKVYGPLVAFKADLFLGIKQNDLKFSNGTWIPDNYPQSYITPMLQMACSKVQHINQFFYLANYGYDQRPDLPKQQVLKQIRELPHYSCGQNQKKQTKQ